MNANDLDLAGDSVFKSYVDGNHELIIKLGKFDVTPNLLNVLVNQVEILSTQLMQSNIFYRYVDQSPKKQAAFEPGARISVFVNNQKSSLLR